MPEAGQSPGQAPTCNLSLLICEMGEGLTALSRGKSSQAQEVTPQGEEALRPPDHLGQLQPSRPHSVLEKDRPALRASGPGLCNLGKHPVPASQSPQPPALHTLGEAPASPQSPPTLLPPEEPERPLQGPQPASPSCPIPNLTQLLPSPEPHPGQTLPDAQ